MAKHTPGPWTLGWGDGLTGPTTPAVTPFCGPNWPYEPISRNGETIAVCPKQDQGHEGDHQANARLIAAAPELAEAVWDLLNEFASENDSAVAKTYGMHAVPVVRRARAVYEKATGIKS